MEVKSDSPRKTQEAGQKLGHNLTGGDVIALYGELGAGKTIFAQGVAKGLGIKKRVLSPTFVFMRSYEFKKKSQNLHFFHIDLYRGEEANDFRALGLEEVFTPDSVVLIEWAEKIAAILPKKTIHVYIQKIDVKRRKIIIKKK